MVTLFSAYLVPFLLAVAAAAGAPVKLPDSPLGRHARAYLEAYAAGDSATIEAFARAHVAAASLARTPMAERVRRFRESKADHGALTLLEVSNDDTAELVVRMRDAHGETVELGIMGESSPPNLLIGIRWEMGGGGGPGGPGGRDLRGGPGPGPGGGAGGPLTEAELAQAIRDEVLRRVKENDFSGVVLLARGDRKLVAEAHGVADRERRKPVTMETRFNCASIGKAFTKVAIAQLAQAGKLALGDPLTKFVPQYQVANAQKITLAQLADHRGGVDDVLRYAEAGQVARGLVDVPAWLHLILDKPLLFEPGTANRYSNGGYVLLGAVIQRVSGVDYYDYVRQHVFAPAGMTASAWDRMHDAAPARAVGYTRGDHERPGGAHAAPAPGAPRRPTTETWPERGSPAGGGYTSAPDLWRFAEALRARKLVSGAWTAWLMGGPEPGAGAAIDTTFAGAGWGIAGGSQGTNGVLELSGPYDVVVLTNDDPPGAEELMRAIRGILRRAPQ